SAASGWFRNPRLPATGADRAGSGPPETVPRPGSGRLPGTDSLAGGRHAAQVIAHPARSDRMVAGMPVRIPRANLLPGSADGGQSAASSPADGQETQTAVLRQRSPERARSRLSGFQRGARRAEGQTARTGEGTDR
ncbi:MAG: hypothetical protein WAK82_02170, partial [Streptosporangiaceae bacterium]